jgi:hypothetical protein
MAVEEPPDRAGRERGPMLVAEQITQLNQRDIHFGFDCCQDHVPVGFDVM